ncbi:hypothetical protein K491DRAFT_714800 [Lophiostoma macrostomum CBS 122681]|uniref:Uncharacterized protein n=1 Tax=Lophiostoma macrostomum CBS 122681 TaxID=1314788 RepID=A0A6A6TAQ7_9PLEO|nr:hypothetical protein K491DRAFT_714800 [Lophiostoma macrostomum CBS 122681]
MPNWNDLPQEMRDEILKQHVTVAAPITGMTHPSHVTRILLRLARTDTKMYHDAVERYYSRNTFAIGKTMSARGLSVWSYPKPAVAQHIKNLVVKVRIQNLPRPDLEASMRGYEDLRFLLRPDDQTAAKITAREYNPDDRFANPWENNVNWTPDAVKWQKSIKRVDRLKVVLVFGEFGLGKCRSGFTMGLDCMPWYYSTAAGKPRDRFVDMVQQACIDVRAKEVDVTVEGLRCGCDGTCAEVYASTIKAMIKASEVGDEDRSEQGEGGAAQKGDYDGVFVVSALDANPRKIMRSADVFGRPKKRIARVGRRWRTVGAELRRSVRVQERELRKRERADEEGAGGAVAGVAAKKLKR